jgi:ketosteroid isomerase-like protein
MTTSTDTTTELVRDYYDSWRNGIASFDETRLRAILAPDLLFEGPIAGTRTGVEPFLRGLADFVRSLRVLRMLRQIHADGEASALYDCELGVTAGTLRFAEFIHVENDRIQSIRLVYDPTEFRRLTA